ncbi:MAG TPA: DUF2721 domain-containing protein [Candidatus Polarisedimenticolaceae bacterium]|nr:DUF2721 domain-containing protein [Candidatus Polarisedimenticolaceae bacterium]
MSQPSLAPIIPVLQVAVGPVILISGVGLLILSMSNRFGRIIDRTRVLGHELKTADAGRRAWAEAQIAILWRRARLMRVVITLAGTSVLFAALLIFALFVTALLELSAVGPIVLLFGSCLVCLVASVAGFVHDLRLSLLALRLELDYARNS